MLRMILDRLFSNGLTVGHIVFIGILFAIVLLGAFMVVSSLMRTADKSYRKTIKNYKAQNKQKKDTGKSLDEKLQDFSKRFTKYIRLNPIDKAEMEQQLMISGFNQTPEEYRAYIYTTAGIFALIGISVLLFGVITKLTLFIIIGIFFMVMTVVVYIFTKNKLKSATAEAMKGIEQELPRFVSYIDQIVSSSAFTGSTLSLLEHYRAVSDKFDNELKLTIADIKTSNFESGMNRWDRRFNSDRLRMVIHGLVAANNGDNVTTYFAMLKRDFTTFEIADLKSRAATLPSKLTPAKMLIFAGVFITVMVPIIVQIAKTIEEIAESGAFDHMF